MTHAPMPLGADCFLKARSSVKTDVLHITLLIRIYSHIMLILNAINFFNILILQPKIYINNSLLLLHK